MPPVQPDAASELERGLSEMSHMPTGAETSALPDQAQDGYRIASERRYLSDWDKHILYSNPSNELLSQFPRHQLGL